MKAQTLYDKIVKELSKIKPPFCEENIKKDENEEKVFRDRGEQMTIEEPDGEPKKIYPVIDPETKETIPGKIEFEIPMKDKNIPNELILLVKAIAYAVVDQIKKEAKVNLYQDLIDSINNSIIAPQDGGATFKTNLVAELKKKADTAKRID